MALCNSDVTELAYLYPVGYGVYKRCGHYSVLP